MTSFDQVPPAEQARRLRRLARAALASFDCSLRRLLLVQHLVNTTFRGGSGEARWLVRVHAGGATGRGLAAVESEVDWVAALARDTGLVVPEPRRTAGGRGAVLASAPGVDGQRVVTVWRWIAGRPVARSRRGVGYYAAAGRLLATLHRHARSWRRPAGFTRPRLGSDALLDGRAARVEAGAWARLPPPVRRDLKAACVRLREAELALGEGPEAFGLIHGDLSFGNVLRLPDGRLAPIDFDDCGLGHFAADVAVPLAGAFGFGGAGFRARQTALLRGYREVAPFPVSWEAVLPRFMAGRAVALALWAAGRPSTDVASTWVEAQWQRVLALRGR